MDYEQYYEYYHGRVMRVSWDHSLQGEVISFMPDGYLTLDMGTYRMMFPVEQLEFVD